MNLVVAATAIIFVGFALQLHLSAAGAVGVGLMSLLNLNEQLALFILLWTLLETSLGAIVRVCSFERDTPQEPFYLSSALAVDADWPCEGRLEFRDICATYRYISLVT